MASQKNLKEFKQYYLEHFAHETNLDEGRGSCNDYMLNLIGQ